MKNLTNNIAKVMVGLGLLALISFPLEAQKKARGNNYYLSKQAKKNIHYYLNLQKANEKNDSYYLEKANEKNAFRYLKKAKGDNYCVSKQAKRYNKHFQKEIRRKERG